MNYLNEVEMSIVLLRTIISMKNIESDSDETWIYNDIDQINKQIDLLNEKISRWQSRLV